MNNFFSYITVKILLAAPIVLPTARVDFLDMGGEPVLVKGFVGVGKQAPKIMGD